MPPEAAADESAEVTLPGGAKVKVTGERVVLVVVIIAILLPLGFFAYKHHESSDQKLDALGERMSEVVYVLSLPQEAREKLNLSMPDSLRRKARRERGRDPE